LFIVSAYRYIATTNLPIIPVFVEYLRHFLIDFNQIYRDSSAPKTRLRAFFVHLSSSGGFRARRRRDFFLLSLCAYHGAGNPSTVSHLAATGPQSGSNFKKKFPETIFSPSLRPEKYADSVGVFRFQIRSQSREIFPFL